MTRKWSTWLIPLWLMSILLSIPLPGEEMNSPIAKGSKVTYFDLLRLIYPDLTVDKDDPEIAAATKAIAIRNLENAQEGVALDDSVITVTGPYTMPSTMKGTSRILMTFVVKAAEVPERILALFDLSGSPKLMDVVGSPGFPDDVGIPSLPMSLNDTTDAYVFGATHVSSNRAFEGKWILFVRGDRMEIIEGVFLLICSECEAGSFEEGVSITTASDPGRLYHKIIISVEFKQMADPPESEHRPRRRPFTRYYTAEYRWDSQANRFVTLSKELERLEAFNKDNL